MMSQGWVSRVETLIRQLQGALGGQSLRSGFVSTSGVVEVGSAGVSAVRNGAGDYTLTFDPPFATTPRVVAMIGPVAAVRSVKQYAGSTTTTSSCRLATYDPSTGASADADFWFVAVG